MFQKMDADETAKIMAKKDNSLEYLSTEKALAREFTTILNISSQEGYLKQYDRMKTKLSPDLFDEYFPSKQYGGWDGYKVKEQEIGVEQIDSQNFLFEIKYLFYNDQDKRTQTYLIRVNTQRIISIESLGI